jgi:hypothetical protein
MMECRCRFTCYCNHKSSHGFSGIYVIFMQNNTLVRSKVDARMLRPRSVFTRAKLYKIVRISYLCMNIQLCKSLQNCSPILARDIHLCKMMQNCQTALVCKTLQNRSDILLPLYEYSVMQIFAKLFATSRLQYSFMQNDRETALVCKTGGDIHHSLLH